MKERLLKLLCMLLCLAGLVWMAGVVTGCSSKGVSAERQAKIAVHENAAQQHESSAFAARESGDESKAMDEAIAAANEHAEADKLYHEDAEEKASPFLDLIGTFIPGAKPLGKLVLAALPLQLLFRRSRKHFADAAKGAVTLDLKNAGVSLAKAYGLVHSEPVAVPAILPASTNLNPTP